MEKAFLRISENLLPGKYKQIICDSSMILLVNENEKDIPAALTQTIEGYWKNSIQIDSALSLYLFLVNVLLRVLDFIRLKILRIENVYLYDIQPYLIKSISNKISHHHFRGFGLSIL